jgi:hypothetical protein
VDAGTGSVGREDFAAVIGGAVVEEDQFKILKSLGEDGVDTPAEEWRVIVVGENNLTGGMITDPVRCRFSVLVRPGVGPAFFVLPPRAQK